MNDSPPGASVRGILPVKNTGVVGCHSLLHGDLPSPGIEPWSPALQVDSLPAEPPEALYQVKTPSRQQDVSRQQVEDLSGLRSVIFVSKRLETNAF